MSLQDSLRSLREFDFNEVDFNNVGSLPTAAKVIAWVLVFVGFIAGGWYLFVGDLQKQLETERVRETGLRQEFEKKAFDAANLDALRKQMAEMEQAFSAMISQLPSDTEVPGLLEDITNRGQGAGLKFNKIELGAERVAEFYVELPIQIEVEGTYHDFGTFISGVAGLPRIVTMHDFLIASPQAKPDKSGKAGKAAPISAAGPLKMTIEARTYRYKAIDDVAAGKDKSEGKGKGKGKKAKGQASAAKAKGGSK